MKVAMLLLAAGRGTRFGSAVPKAYLPLDGEPLLLRSARRLAEVVDLHRGDGVLVVVVDPRDREAHLPAVLPALQALGALRIEDGGADRQQSMQRGLAAAGPDCDLVLVHDAARPLFPVAGARACIQAAAACGAALLAVPAPDTLKRVQDGKVVATLDRAGVFLAQTPQVVRAGLLQQALARAAADGFSGTDDVSLVEHLGHPVQVVAGSPYNLKITHPEDLALASAILASAANP